MFKRNVLILTALFLISICITGGVFADDFPSKSFSFIVPSTPGGGEDAYARGLAQVWKKYLPKGINVIVQNKPGAGNRVGVNFMYKAKPDGYTLGIVPIPGMVAAQLFQDTIFDLNKMEWLGSMDVGARMVCMSAKSGMKTIEDLKKADDVVVAVSGITGSSGVTTIIAFDLLGIKWRPINLEGSAPAITAVLRGDASVLNFNVTSLMQFVESGDFIPLFVTGVKNRIKELPDVPTFNELGFPVGSYLADVRTIGIGPGVPEDRLRYLKKTIWQALSDPEFHEYGKRTRRTTNILNAEDTKKAIDTLFEVFIQKKESLRKHLVK